MPSSSHPRKDEEPQSEYQKTKALCLSVAPEEILRKDQPPEEQGVAEHVFVKCLGERRPVRQGVAELRCDC